MKEKEKSQEDDEFLKRINIIDEAFRNWLDTKNDLLEVPISESLGEAFFKGWELAEARYYDNLHNVRKDLEDIKAVLNDISIQSCNRGNKKV